MVEAITPNLNNKTEIVDSSALLNQKFQEVKDKQGILGSVWNEVKEVTGCGFSEKDCKSMLDKYNRGEISFDEAVEYINKYDKKQTNMSDLGANIITGIASIAAATCLVSGPIGWAAALLIGAPVGAAVKAGVKIFDRFTNKVKGDEFDKKQLTKDVISGAVTGMTSAVASGVGAGIKAGSFKLAVKNGTKCGVQCGAVAGATSYTTDVMLDKDKYFNLGDFAKTTLTSAFVSGTVGGVVGAGMYGLSNNIGKDVSKTIKETIIDDSLSSSSRKVLGQAERSIMSLA
ncbi:MAG: hypothetical protein K6E29_09880 [Cyanobacteria bacterium RUI128]|nr:hypothetical protein [Cyanobacteria bacterium RUI128]